SARVGTRIGRRLPRRFGRRRSTGGAWIEDDRVGPARRVIHQRWCPALEGLLVRLSRLTSGPSSDDDGVMLRATLLSALILLAPCAGGGQTLSVLHIKVQLVDTDGKTTPVPRHALLISDNPSTSAPRRVVTTVEGTADVRLRPGNYTVESDQPVVFHGKAYQWTKTLDIVAGRDAVLELTAANADSEVAGATPSSESA